MNPSGLTLIEVVAAIAVVSMLTAAALRTAASISRLAARERERNVRRLSDRPLRDVLEADLLHASHYRDETDGVSLATQVALDPSTMAQRHYPTIVSYEVRTIGSRRWLIRAQGPHVGGAGFQELCSSGVRAVKVEATGSPPAGRSAERWRQIGAGTALTVEFEDPRRPSMVIRPLQE